MAEAIGKPGGWNVAPQADGLIYIEDLEVPQQPNQSWAERSAAATEFAVEFNSSADLPNYNPPYPTIGEAVGQWGRVIDGGGWWTNCVYDTNLNAMRLNVNPNEPGQGAGEWARNFDLNLVSTIGEGETFYVQFAFFASYPWLDWTRNSGGPPKICNISSADTLSPPEQWASCTQKEIVSTLVDATRSGSVTSAFHFYSKCGSPSDLADRGAQTNPGEGPLKQPRWNGTGYDEGYRFNGGSPGLLPGNIFKLIPPWTWTYLTYEIQLGTWDAPNSTIKVWHQTDYGAKTLVMDLRDHIIRSGDGEYAKLWLTAFSTGKSSANGDDAYCYTGFRQALASKTPIADPFTPDAEKTVLQLAMDGLSPGQTVMFQDSSGGDPANILGPWGTLSSQGSNAMNFATSLGSSIHTKKLWCQTVGDPGPQAGCPLYREETHQWLLVQPPPSQSGPASGTSHAYDFATAYDDRLERHVYQAYAASNNAEVLDLASESWSVDNSIPSHAQTNNRGSSSNCWWPGHGYVYYGAGFSGQNEIKLWRENSQQWLTLQPGNPGALGPYAQYNPVYDCCFVGGQDGDNQFWRVTWDRAGYSTSNYSIDAISTAGAPGEISSNFNMALVAQDPASGDMIVIDQSLNMYAYDPSQNSWSTVGNFGLMFPTNVQNALVASIRNYGGGLFFLTSGSGDTSNYQMWLYKHANPAPFDRKVLASI